MPGNGKETIGSTAMTMVSTPARTEPTAAATPVTLNTFANHDGRDRATMTTMNLDGRNLAMPPVMETAISRDENTETETETMKYGKSLAACLKEIKEMTDCLHESNTQHCETLGNGNKNPEPMSFDEMMSCLNNHCEWKERFIASLEDIAADKTTLTKTVPETMSPDDNT